MKTLSKSYDINVHILADEKRSHTKVIKIRLREDYYIFDVDGGYYCKTMQHIKCEIIIEKNNEIIYTR